MTLLTALKRLSDGQSLSTDQTTAAFRDIMRGEATNAQIGALLSLLKLKGETVDEMVGAVNTLREFALPLKVDLRHAIDTCGTGGDGQNLFNVSTAVAFVAACADVTVAKHGNRSVSSKTGSADVLEAAGVRIDLTPAQIERCIAELNIGFLFAPAHHSATRFAAPVRRELGFRTLFNLIGPLCNPAMVQRQVMGVFDQRWLQPVAQTLERLGSVHVMVVHAHDGLDEISNAGSTDVVELKNGAIQQWTLNPADYGVAPQSLDALRVSDAHSSLALIRMALHSSSGAAHDILALNAGAAIYVAGRATDLSDGIAQAKAILRSGAALARLQALATLTNQLGQ
jgi:anthranilate phosphoribosyltransferase